MDKKKNTNMAEELFTMPVQNDEFWIPPKPEAEYIKILKTRTSFKKKLNSLAALVEIYRSQGLSHGGRYSEDGCKKLIDLMKRHASTVYMKRGIAKMALSEGGYCEKVGDFPKAIRFYETSIGIYGLKDPLLRYLQLNNLAFCFNFYERYSDAEKLLRKAITVLPHRHNAWKNLGVALEHQGQFEEAAECYLKAIIFCPGDHRSRWHLDRLVERYPSLKGIPAIKEWISDSE